jgi:hypothetical protein
MNSEQMMAQIEQLTQQLLTLQAATKDRAKLAPPTAFEGKVNSNVLTWLLTVEAYFHGCNTPAERWPVVTSTYLKAAALDWYHSWIRTNNGVATWDAFKTAICARFRPVDSNRIGRGQLMELRMRTNDRGRGILQYVDRFNQLVNQVTDITENEKFTYFNQGLTPELQRLLIPLTHINTVDQAISMVIRYELLSQSQDISRSSSHQRAAAPPSSAWTSQRSWTSSTATTSTPMELGTMTTEPEATTEPTDQLLAMRNERLSPQQMEEHKRLGLCFRCHQQGHMSRQCPKGGARK